MVRKKVPQEMVTRVLYHSSGCCCVCGNSGIVIHHIEGRNNNDFDNLCPLCPNHHDIAHKKSGLTKNFAPASLKEIRDKFYLKVEVRRFGFINNQVKTSDKPEFILSGKQGYEAQGKIMMDKKGDIHFLLKLMIPKALKYSDYLSDLGRFTFGAWDERFIICKIRKNKYGKKPAKKYGWVQTKLISSVLKELREVIYNPLTDCLVHPNILNRAKFVKLNTSLTGNLIKDATRELVAGGLTDFEVKIDCFKLFESLYTQINLFILYAQVKNSVIGIAPFKVELRKKNLIK